MSNSKAVRREGRATLEDLRLEVQKVNGHLTALAPEGQVVELELIAHPGMKLRLWSTKRSCTSVHHCLGGTKVEALAALEGMAFGALVQRRVLQGL